MCLRVGVHYYLWACRVRLLSIDMRVVRVLGACESIWGGDWMTCGEDTLIGRMRAVRELGDVADAVKLMGRI